MESLPRIAGHGSAHRFEHPFASRDWPRAIVSSEPKLDGDAVLETRDPGRLQVDARLAAEQIQEYPHSPSTIERSVDGAE